MCPKSPYAVFSYLPLFMPSPLPGSGSGDCEGKGGRFPGNPLEIARCVISQTTSRRDAGLSDPPRARAGCACPCKKFWAFLVHAQESIAWIPPGNKTDKPRSLPCLAPPCQALPYRAPFLALPRRATPRPATFQAMPGHVPRCAQ